jgi:hypothetical protein
LPYVAGRAADASGPPFPRASGVPFRAPAAAFGRGRASWHRVEVGPGRNGVAGATLRRAAAPEPLPAGEHHRRRDGVDNYVATAAGAGRRPGAAPGQTAGAEGLQAAYGAFKAGARDARPGHAPARVSADGRAPTHRAWLCLFPLAAPRRCLPHGWWNVRSRGKLDESFGGLSEKVWHACRADGRRPFGRRMRRPREWAKADVSGAWLLAQVKKPCGRSKEYAKAYAHPGGRRTSSAPGGVMRAMSRHFDDGRHLHGSGQACRWHVRARALLDNYRPWRPAVARANGGRRCPAERLNQHRYHHDWLQNLLASASPGGYRRRIAPPPTP